MSYSVVRVPSFAPGLNLRDKEDAVQPGEAIDLMNVEFHQRGAMSQRAGYTNFTPSTLTNAGASLQPFYRTGAAAQLIVGAGTRLEALDTSGSVVASDTALTSGTWDFVRFGGPNTERVYAGQGETTLRRWDGTSWTGVSNTPKAGALAVMATSNRLVAGRFNGTTGGPTGGASTSSPSHIYFSAPGDPETWDADDSLQVTPGDGEKVQAIIGWREFVFVFKETKFFVITGETVDGDGNPEFLVTPFETGVGLCSPRAVATDDRGVYFLDRTGVYRTNGQEPELLSDLISPVFLGGSSVFYDGGELAHSSITNCAMGYHDHRLYLGFSTASANDRTLAFDPQFGWWSLYDFPAAAFASFRISNQSELVFAAASGDKHVHRHNASETNDYGSAITSRWRSGWEDFGEGSQKVVAEEKMWGQGVVSVGVADDYGDAPGPLVEIDMSQASAGTNFGGTGTFGGDGYFGDVVPGLTPRLRRKSNRGTVFSTTFKNSTLDQPWRVDRYQYHVRTTLNPSVRQTDNES